MTICAYSGCRNEFTPKRKDKRFCSASCKTRDNLLKRQKAAAALSVGLALSDWYRLTPVQAEIIVARLDLTWLTRWLHDNFQFVWIDGDWQMIEGRR